MKKGYKVVMSLVVLLFSVSVFANVSDNIVCVRPDTAGEDSTEGGTNPCNLLASTAERDVNVAGHATTLQAEAANRSTSEPKKGSSGSEDAGAVQ